jgi:uncharacterized protein YbgA (DUF1722 family)/uncharacterized protein YbbK (DUF523 family)
MNKLSLGVSSCLLGHPVRYDGRHKQNDYIARVLCRFFECCPVCPEVESGLSIPREPMILEGDIKHPRLMTQITRRDYTEHMLIWSDNRCILFGNQRFHGYIFKSKSPSCGLHHVEIFDTSGAAAKMGRGLFAAAFVNHFPVLPVVDENTIAHRESRDAFIERIFVFNRWLSMKAAESPRDLLNFHTAHKYLLMSHSIDLYRRCGRLVASLNTRPFTDIISEYRVLFFRGFSYKATIRKNINVLMHILGYFKTHLSGHQKQELLDLFSQYRENRISLLIPLIRLREYAFQFGIQYLLDQVFLNPHPVEIQLRYPNDPVM